MEANKIIITGAATRMGAAIAKKLSGPNVEIVIHYNKSKLNAEKLQKELKKNKTKVWLIKGDLSKENDLKKLECGCIVSKQACLSERRYVCACFRKNVNFLNQYLSFILSNLNPLWPKMINFFVKHDRNYGKVYLARFKVRILH